MSDKITRECSFCEHLRLFRKVDSIELAEKGKRYIKEYFNCNVCNESIELRRMYLFKIVDHRLWYAGKTLEEGFPTRKEAAIGAREYPGTTITIEMYLEDYA